MNTYGKNCYIEGYEQAMLEAEEIRQLEREYDQAVFTYYIIQKLTGLIFIVLSYAVWKVIPVAFLVVMPLMTLGAYMLVTSDRVLSGYPEEPEEI